MRRNGGTRAPVLEELQAFAALNTATLWSITLTAQLTEETAVIRSMYVYGSVSGGNREESPICGVEPPTRLNDEYFLNIIGYFKK